MPEQEIVSVATIAQQIEGLYASDAVKKRLDSDAVCA
jgi:hypothetical protein